MKLKLRILDQRHQVVKKKYIYKNILEKVNWPGCWFNIYCFIDVPLHHQCTYADILLK